MLHYVSALKYEWHLFGEALVYYKGVQMKIAPVSRGLGNNRANYFIFHTGQHYYYNLNKVFFEQQKFANKVSRSALVLNPEHRVSSPKD